MTAPGPHDQLAAVATHVRHQRALSRFGSDLRRPEFWRDLAPELTVGGDRPVATISPPELGQETVERCTDQLVAEGYVHLAAVCPSEVEANLLRAIHRIVDAGLPPAFAFAYDETYALFAMIGDVLAPILGPRPRLLTEQCWAFFVAPGDPAMTRWSAFSPHRDWLGGDPGVIAHDRPTVLSLWVPLTNVTTIDSCMYVVPAPQDPGYFAAEYRTAWDRLRLQDVRAVPANSGDVLGWSTHLAHWGSRSSRFATQPRVSITADLQRRDTTPYGAAVDLDAPIPFEARVERILASLASQVPAS